MGQTIQLRRVRMRPGMGDITVPIGPLPSYDFGAPQMPEVPMPLQLPVFKPVTPQAPATINVPLGPMPAIPNRQAILSAPLPSAPSPAAATAASSWMAQEWITGLPNKYLLYGGGAILALSMLKKKKGRRR